MLFKDMIAVYSKNNNKPITTLCGQNSKLLIVEASDTCVATEL
jgi:hypothetical protein